MTDFDPEYPHTLMIHFADGGFPIRGCRISQFEDGPHIYTLGMSDDSFWSMHDAFVRRARLKDEQSKDEAIVPEPICLMQPFNDTDTWLADGEGKCDYCGTTYDKENWHPDYTIGWIALIPADQPTKKVEWSDGDWTDEVNVVNIACADCAEKLRVSEASLKHDIFANDE